MSDANASNIGAAKEIVRLYFNSNVDKTDDYVITDDEIYVVWFCKTLQHWKALLSTTVPDTMYYEVTYNGDEDEAYLDAYKKVRNVKYLTGDMVAD